MSLRFLLVPLLAVMVTQGVEAKRRPFRCDLLTPPKVHNLTAECEKKRQLKDRAECLFKMRKYEEARGLYESLLAKSASEERLPILFHLSQSTARSGEYEAALSINREILEEFPQGRKRTLRNIAFLLMTLRHYEEALPVLQEVLESASRRERTGLLHQIAWCHYALGRWEEAIRWLDQSGVSPFVLYWKGRSLERLGRKKEARAAYREVLELYPKGYYALRSLERGFKKGERKTFFKEWWSPSVSLRRKPKEEHPDYRIPYAGFLFSQVVPYKKEISPFFLYALMRQESHYKESARSPAGARGLMQLMPETADKWARIACREGVDPDRLFEPHANIALASVYLRELSRLFERRWYAVAAAYSAGEENVSHWLSARKDLDEEEFIEEIPYAETRDYVKRIYVNLAAYQWIYR